MNNPYKLKISKRKYTGVQLALHDSVIKVLQTNDINKVNVKQLCTEAAVSRSSFYTYYESVSDLIIELEEKFINQLATLDLKIEDSNRIMAKDFNYLSPLIDFVIEHETFIEGFLVKNYDYHLVNKWKQAIKHHLWERIKPSANTVKIQLSFEMFASEIISAFIFGIKHKEEIQKNDIYEIAAKALKLLD